MALDKQVEEYQTWGLIETNIFSHFKLTSNYYKEDITTPKSIRLLLWFSSPKLKVLQIQQSIQLFLKLPN